MTPGTADVAVGTRIELVRCTDPYTRLRPGTRGTVTSIDDMGTVHMRWDDDGGTLGLVPGEDTWKVLTTPPDQGDPTP